MGFIELFFLAAGLSMDAFAVAVCAGLTMRKSAMTKALIIGLYFGVFQAAMPLLGYFAATFFASMIVSFDHWIAFALLSFIGGKMVVESLKGDKEDPTDGSADPADSTASPNISAPAQSLSELSDLSGSATSPNISAPATALPEASVGPAHMLPLAIATSIDALAVGISFAFLRVDIFPAVTFIGITTFVFSIAGVKIGNVFGAKFKSKAELAGGVILILIGLRILLEHLGISLFII